MRFGKASNIAILIILFWIAAVPPLISAKESKDKPKESPYFQLGVKLLKNKVHAQLALCFLSQAVIEEPKNLAAKYYLAEAYKSNGQFEKAKKWFFKLYKLANSDFPNAKWEYARILLMEQEKESLSLLLSQEEIPEEYKDVKEGFEQIDVNALRPNTLYVDDKKKQYSGIINFKGEKALVIYEKVYKPWDIGLSKKLKSDKVQAIMDSISQPKILLLNGQNYIDLPEPLSDWFYCGLPAFNDKGNEVYVTLYQMDIDKGRQYSMFYSFRDAKGRWSKLTKFSKVINDGKSNVRFPFLYEGVNGEKALFYACDRDDGYGGYDLYYSSINAEFEASISYNLGSEVNSSGHDISPFVKEENRTLYFASNGKKGFGALDIYKAYGDLLDGFSALKGLEIPYNSLADEWSCFIGEDSTKPIINTNRNLGLEHLTNAIVGFENVNIKSSESGPLEKIKEEESEVSIVNDEIKAVVQSDSEPTKQVLDASELVKESTTEEELFIPSEDLGDKSASDQLQDFLMDSQEDSIDVNANFYLKIRMFDKLTKRPMSGGVVIFTKSQNDESIQKNGPGKQYLIKGQQEIIFMIQKENYEEHKFRVSTMDKVPNQRIIHDVYLRHKLNEDEKAYERLLEDCGNLQKEGLVYRVQIGAFRTRKLNYFENLNLGYRILEQYIQGLYKYLVYNAPTPYEIDNVRQDLINQGVSDAFVVPYYKNKRITVKRSLELLIPN